MDLYDIYEELFPDMPEEEFYRLPGPISILEAEGCGIDWAEVCLGKSGYLMEPDINTQYLFKDPALLKAFIFDSKSWFENTVVLV